MAAMKYGSVVNGFTIETEPTNDRSGTAIWAFAKKGSTEYFIKQYLTPKRPAEVLSDDENARREVICAGFEREKRRLFERLPNDLPHAVRPALFHDDAAYYATSKRLEEIENPAKVVESLPFQSQLAILRQVTIGIGALHHHEIIHCDIKSENVVLSPVEERRKLHATVIDLDSAFLVGCPPTYIEELICDQMYASPEVYVANRQSCSATWRKHVSGFTTKADIFSLGVLFHFYLSGGSFPRFGDEKPLAPAHAILDGKKPKFFLPGTTAPLFLRLLEEMLHVDPASRPSASAVIGFVDILRGCPPRIPRRRWKPLLKAIPDSEAELLLKKAYIGEEPDDSKALLSKVFGRRTTKSLPSHLTVAESHSVKFKRDVADVFLNLHFSLLSKLLGEEDTAWDMPSYDQLHTDKESVLSERLKIKIREPAARLPSHAPKKTESAKLKGTLLRTTKKTDT